MANASTAAWPARLNVLPKRDRRFFDPACVPAYATNALMMATILLAVTLGGYDLDTSLARDCGAALALFLGCAWLARWIGFPKIGDPLEAVMLFLLFAFLAPLCAVVAARTNLPLADDALRRADSLLFGFDRAAFVAPINAVPWLHRLWVNIYNSLTVQPFILIPALFMTGRAERAWILLSAWGIALVLNVAISPAFPAFGMPPYVLKFIGVLETARAGSLTVLDATALTGIITFPSFHAAAATMLAWAASGYGRMAFPLVLLNCAMIASALIVGGHYLIDLPAGMLVAVAAIMLAKRFQRQLSDPRRSAV